MPQNENTPTETPAMDLETATRINEQRLTRRAALRKLGFGAGMAALALLSTDDLARMVGRRLEQVAGDNRVAETVAKELREAGVAFAGTPQPPQPTPCGEWENPGHNSAQCEPCQVTVTNRCYSVPGVTRSQCDYWSSQCDKFCGTGDFNSWYNCWSGYSDYLP